MRLGLVACLLESFIAAHTIAPISARTATWDAGKSTDTSRCSSLLRGQQRLGKAQLENNPRKTRSHRAPGGQRTTRLELIVASDLLAGEWLSLQTAVRTTTWGNARNKPLIAPGHCENKKIREDAEYNPSAWLMLPVPGTYLCLERYSRFWRQAILKKRWDISSAQHAVVTYPSFYHVFAHVPVHAEIGSSEDPYLSPEQKPAKSLAMSWGRGTAGVAPTFLSSSDGIAV